MEPEQDLNFNKRVYQVVNSIPSGKVMSYGQVAALADSPRAARQVGWALSGLGLEEQKIPWWRVVNKAGYLSIKGHSIDVKDIQKQLLQDEGIEVDDDYQVDMQKFQVVV